MNTPDPAPATPLSDTVSRPDRVFPTLTKEQIARIAPHGRRRAITAGDVLVEIGDKAVPFFVVLSGEIEALRPSDKVETLLVRHRAGQFSGEANMISGQRSMGRLRVTVSGEALELTRERLLALIQTDAELSERGSGLKHLMDELFRRNVIDQPTPVRDERPQGGPKSLEE